MNEIEINNNEINEKNQIVNEMKFWIKIKKQNKFMKTQINFINERIICYQAMKWNDWKLNDVNLIYYSI